MAAYASYWVRYNAIRLAAVVLLILMVVTPPLLILSAFTIVRDWWVEQDVVLIENAGYVVLIGILGPIPYLFAKSMAMINGALKAVGTKLQAVMLRPCRPDYTQRTTLRAVAAAMFGSLSKALVASWRLIAALATSGAIVLLAGTVAVPPVALVTVETADVDVRDGSTATHRDVHRLVAGSDMRVHVSCAAGDETQTCVPVVGTTVVSQPDLFGGPWGLLPLGR